MITVVIPVFNGEYYINRSVKSLINQTVKCKIIIINDGSTDNTSQMCQELSKEYTNIQYIETLNQGVSNARNLGIMHCQTEYLSFLDCDDTYEPRFIELMLKQINKNSDICYCNRYNVYEDGRTKNTINFTTKNIFINYLKNKTAPQTNCWVIKHEFLKRNQICFDKDLKSGEDILFFSRILMKKPKISYVNQELVNYYMDIPNSLSKDLEGKIEREIIWINRLAFEVKSSEISEKEKKKAIKILYKYRQPVGLLSLIINMDNPKDKKKQLLKEYSKELDLFNLSNGLRSFKAIILYLILTIKIKYKMEI